MTTNDLLIYFMPSLLTFIGGGGLSYFFTIRYTKKQAEADAMKSMQDVYQQLIHDLQFDRQQLKEEKKQNERELLEKIDELTKTVERNTQDIADLKRLRCNNISCKDRN